MSANPFEPGAAYLVKADVGDMRAGDRVIFWRHTYSYYDGIDFYFFAAPEAYYEGRPGPDGRPASADLFALQLHNGERSEEWGTELGRVAGPRDGAAWMVRWWEGVLAEALKKRQG